jgi:hypothetical protein
MTPLDLVADVCQLVEEHFAKHSPPLGTPQTDYAVGTQLISGPDGRPSLVFTVALVQPSPVLGERLVHVELVAAARPIDEARVAKGITNGLAALKSAADAARMAPFAPGAPQ